MFNETIEKMESFCPITQSSPTEIKLEVLRLEMCDFLMKAKADITVLDMHYNEMRSRMESRVDEIQLNIDIIDKKLVSMGVGHV